MCAAGLDRHRGPLADEIRVDVQEEARRVATGSCQARDDASGDDHELAMSRSRAPFWANNPSCGAKRPTSVATRVEAKSPKGQPLEGSSPSGGWPGVSGAAELLLTAIHGRALSGQFRLSQNLELLRCSDEPSQASR